MSNDLYKPLSSPSCIRLLSVTRQSRNVVTCSLAAFELEEAPEYEAISYAWGDATEQRVIIVDGRTVSIRHNLYNAILRFTCKTGQGPSLFWVDALCISQDDLDEKSRQMAMIGRIFGQARCVLAWIGQQADNSQLLFGPKRLESILGTSRLEPHPATTMAHFWRPTGGPTHDTPEQAFRTAWEALFARTYWRRRWIIQEIANAKHVFICCGSDRWRWEDFFIANDCDDFLFGYDPPFTVRPSVQAWAVYKPMKALRQLDGNGAETRNLLENMLLFQETKCSDPLDKVYSLLPRLCLRYRLGCDSVVTRLQPGCRGCREVTGPSPHRVSVVAERLPHRAATQP